MDKRQFRRKNANGQTTAQMVNMPVNQMPHRLFPFNFACTFFTHDVLNLHGSIDVHGGLLEHAGQFRELGYQHRLRALLHLQVLRRKVLSGWMKSAERCDVNCECVARVRVRKPGFTFWSCSKCWILSPEAVSTAAESREGSAVVIFLVASIFFSGLGSLGTGATGMTFSSSTGLTTGLNLSTAPTCVRSLFNTSEFAPSSAADRTL